MGRLHRTRRVRNERWYSAWDVLALAMLSPVVVKELGASRDSRGLRRWARWYAVIWHYPLLLRRVHALPILLFLPTFALTALLFFSRNHFSAAAFVLSLVLIPYFAAYKTPLLLVASHVRSRPLDTVHTLRDRPPSLCQIVAKIVIARREAWQMNAARWRFVNHGHFYDGLTMTLSVLPVALFASGHLNERLDLVPYWNSGLAFLATIVATCIILGRPSVLYRRLTRRVLRSCCPDCNYTLTGIPNAIEPDLLNGVHTGPARCPECGTHWPLIPPPVPSR